MTSEALPSILIRTIETLGLKSPLERLSSLPLSLSSRIPDNPLLRMGIGAVVCAPVGVGISYVASGGMPLSELMLQSTINSKSIFSMSLSEISQQAATAAAFLGLPFGAFLGAASSNKL